MRAIGPHRLLLAENSGQMSIVTFEGPEKQKAMIQTIKEGLESTPGVTTTRGMAWIVEGKLNYRNDANLKDQRSRYFQNVRRTASEVTSFACRSPEKKSQTRRECE